MSQRVFTSRKFFPLFIVQFTGAINDNLLRNSMLVLITFSSLTLFNLPKSQVANLAILCLIIPNLIFASYAGKLADSVDKVKIVRIIKLCELPILGLAAFGFYSYNSLVLILALLAMGIHSSFFLPIRYSILPQYLPKNKIVMASGYIELGMFVGILAGQALGGWLMASHHMHMVVNALFLISLIGLFFSYRMAHALPTNNNVSFTKNFLKDNIEMYQQVTKDPLIWKSIHSIGWFWGIGVINTLQLSFLTMHYLGGSAQVFATVACLLSIGIGIGSLLCAKVSREKVVHRYVVYGAVGWALAIICLLILNHKLVNAQLLNIGEYIQSFKGVLSLTFVFLMGVSAGFYSLTCYSELPLIAPPDIRAQVISTTNFIAAWYQFVALAISSVLLELHVYSWGLMFTVACLNILFAIWYTIKK